MKRVAILGPAGSGKSRLARELAEILDLPVVHLDGLFWRPGWVPMADPEWAAVQRREAGRETWIADGLQEDRRTPVLWLDAADTIVFIDASPLACVWRIAKRRLESTSGPEVPTAKPAPYYRALPKVLAFTWQYRTRARAGLLAELSRRGQLQHVVVLRSDDDRRRFLEDAKAQ